MTEYGLDCQIRHSKSCVVNDWSLSTESSDWIPKYKQLSYSVYVRGSKNGRKNRADGRGKGHGHVQPCPLLTRFSSSVNTAAQSYAAGFASKQGPLRDGPFGENFQLEEKPRIQERHSRCQDCRRSIPISSSSDFSFSLPPFFFSHDQSSATFEGASVCF